MKIIIIMIEAKANCKLVVSCCGDDAFSSLFLCVCECCSYGKEQGEDVRSRGDQEIRQLLVAVSSRRIHIEVKYVNRVSF